MFKIVFVFFILSLIVSCFVMAGKGAYTKENLITCIKFIVFPATVAACLLATITLIF